MPPIPRVWEGGVSMVPLPRRVDPIYTKIAWHFPLFKGVRCPTGMSLCFVSVLFCTPHCCQSSFGFLLHDRTRQIDGTRRLWRFASVVRHSCRRTLLFRLRKTCRKATCCSHLLLLTLQQAHAANIEQVAFSLLSAGVYRGEQTLKNVLILELKPYSVDADIVKKESRVFGGGVLVWIQCQRV